MSNATVPAQTAATVPADVEASRRRYMAQTGRTYEQAAREYPVRPARLPWAGEEPAAVNARLGLPAGAVS